MPRRKREKKKNLIEIAAWFGLSVRTIRDWFDDGCPCKGGPYDTYLMAEWYFCERRVGDKDKSIDVNLKRRRLEQQIKSDELDYAERINELMPRAHASHVFAVVAAELRKAGELLQRQFGDDAQLVILEALESTDRILSEKFKQ